jgi:hypothetical protein
MPAQIILRLFKEMTFFCYKTRKDLGPTGAGLTGLPGLLGLTRAGLTGLTGAGLTGLTGVGLTGLTGAGLTGAGLTGAGLTGAGAVHCLAMQPQARFVERACIP